MASEPPRQQCLRLVNAVAWIAGARFGLAQPKALRFRCVPTGWILDQERRLMRLLSILDIDCPSYTLAS